MIPKLLLIGAVAMLSAGTAHGKECKGVNFPEQIQAEGNSLALNGLGLRQATAFKVNVYVAALYASKTSTEPNALLEAAVPKAQSAALKDRIAMLGEWMTDMKSGQRLTFTYKPGAGVQVDVNGAVKGTLKGDDFAKAFFSIWLGAEPPNPEIKTGLLGGTCG